MSYATAKGFFYKVFFSVRRVECCRLSATSMNGSLYFLLFADERSAAWFPLLAELCSKHRWEVERS
jgi:hypothetical protein